MMLAKTGEITFADIDFARMVMSVLIAKGYAEELEILQRMG
jgi:hypothetical protein